MCPYVYDLSKVSKRAIRSSLLVLQSTYDCPPQTLFRIFTNPGKLVTLSCDTSLAVVCIGTSTAAWNFLLELKCGVNMGLLRQGDPVSADNTGIFRDIKKRGKRKVLELDPAGRKIVEVSDSANMSMYACWRFRA